MDPMHQAATHGQRLKALIGMASSPVGVRFLTGAEQPAGVQVVAPQRYCQAQMRAHSGESVLLNRGSIACQAAAVAFGLQTLPKGLQAGKALVESGIVSDEAAGRCLLQTMPRLTPGQIQGLHLFPLERAGHVPDVVVIEGDVELQWIALAFLNATGDGPVQSSPAVLRATCVGSAVIPYREGRVYLGHGCYGCRHATDHGADKTVLGLPISTLPAFVEYLQSLEQRTLPTARSKPMWAAAERRGQVRASGL